jgi:hypothetical protein
MAILWHRGKKTKETLAIVIYFPFAEESAMDRFSIILSTLMILSLLILWSPGVLALNNGKILQNIALWLAIFLGCALLYKNFGPDSAHPLFRATAGYRTAPSPVENAPAPTTTPSPPASSSGNSQSF